MAATSQLEAAWASTPTNLEPIDDSAYDVSGVPSSQRNLQKIVMYNGPCTDPEMETSCARSAGSRDFESDGAEVHRSNSAWSLSSNGEKGRVGVDEIHDFHGSFVGALNSSDKVLRGDSTLSETASWILLHRPLPSDQEAFEMIARERDESDSTFDAHQFEGAEELDNDPSHRTRSITSDKYQQRRMPTDAKVLAQIERNGPEFDVYDEPFRSHSDPDEMQPSEYRVATVPHHLLADEVDETGSDKSAETATPSQSQLPEVLPTDPETQAGAESGRDGAVCASKSSEDSGTESRRISNETTPRFVNTVTQWLDTVEVDETAGETDTVAFDDSKSVSETGWANEIDSASSDSLTGISGVFIAILDWLSAAATVCSESPASEVDGGSCITITQTDHLHRDPSQGLFVTVSTWLDDAETDGGSEAIREIEWEEYIDTTVTVREIEREEELEPVAEIPAISSNPQTEQSVQQLQLQWSLSRNGVNGQPAQLDLGLFAALTLFYLILGCLVDVVGDMEWHDIIVSERGNSAPADNALWDVAVAMFLAVLSIRILHLRA